MTDNDKKKQIEEMAKDVTGSIDWCRLEDDFLTVDCFRTAEALYEKGYCKQSEGEWDDSIIGFCNVCMSCGAIVERAAIKNNSGKLNFCPNCGKKMKGGAHE